jgi:hypothetical protein
VLPLPQEVTPIQPRDTQLTQQCLWTQFRFTRGASTSRKATTPGSSTLYRGSREEVGGARVTTRRTSERKVLALWADILPLTSGDCQLPYRTKPDRDSAQIPIISARLRLHLPLLWSSAPGVRLKEPFLLFRCGQYDLCCTTVSIDIVRIMQMHQYFTSRQSIRSRLLGISSGPIHLFTAIHSRQNESVRSRVRKCWMERISRLLPALSRSFLRSMLSKPNLTRS